MTTCTKLFAQVPFAHRQPNHDGHCRWVHGHNWDIEVTFLARELDINGFVMDFGKLGRVKQWIDEHLDHGLLIVEKDPELEFFKSRNGELWKLFVVPDGSSEGLAQVLHSLFDRLVQSETSGRVTVKEVRVFEDQKNSATYSLP